MAQTKFVKPIIVVSQCLTGAVCRWDGDRLNWPFARLLKQYARLVPVCPEMEIGLGCPRPKIKIVDRKGSLSLCQPSTGHDITRTMTSFARKHLSGLIDVDGFLLKSRSPSCGLRDTKLFASAEESARMIGRGSGLYAAEVLRRYPGVPAEDENRLDKNHALREQWLTRVFLSADFRSVKRQPSLGRLTNFHRRHKHLLRAYNKKRTRELDRLLGSAKSASKVVAECEKLIALTMKRPARPAAMVESMEPAFEHYAPHLDRVERRKYRRLAEQCFKRQAPISDLRKQLQVWAVRYDKNFVRKHSLYRPYPGALAPAKGLRREYK